MTLDEIRKTVLKSKLFNCTINSDYPMWELIMEDADFPIKHTVYLYVNTLKTHLVGGYISIDLAADKKITEKQVFSYPIVDLNKVRMMNCINSITKAQYELIKKEKDYNVNQNLQKIQEDFNQCKHYFTIKTQIDIDSLGVFCYIIIIKQREVTNGIWT